MLRVQMLITGIIGTAERTNGGSARWTWIVRPDAGNPFIAYAGDFRIIAAL